MRWLAVLGMAMTAAGGMAAQQPVRQVPPAAAPAQPRAGTLLRDLPDGHFEVLVQRRARLGVSVNFLPQDTDTLGAVINGVTPNGPAARAGLRTGDIITAINGNPLVVPGLRTPRNQSAPGIRLRELSSQLDPGDTVVVQFRRADVRRIVTLVAGDEPAMAWVSPEGEFAPVTPEPAWEGPEPAGALPEGYRITVRTDSTGATRTDDMRVPRERTPMPPGMAMPLLDGPLAQLELAPLNSELGRYFGTTEGILVIRSPRDSRLNLQGGDVILTVDGRAPDGPAHLLRMLRSYNASEVVRFEVVRMRKREVVRGVIGPEAARR